MDKIKKQSMYLNKILRPFVLNTFFDTPRLKKLNIYVTGIRSVTSERDKRNCEHYHCSDITIRGRLGDNLLTIFVDGPQMRKV